MPVGHAPSKRFFSISKNGKIRYKDRDTNQEHFYDYIEGILTKIDLVKDEYEGEEIYKWHFYLEDEHHTQTDVLQVGEASSAARGILMTLFCVDGPIGHVYISPYKKPDSKFTNVWVEHNRQTVDWKEEVKNAIPEAQVVQIGTRQIVDDTERRKFFRLLAARIKNEKLGVSPAQAAATAPRPAPGPMQQPATPAPDKPAGSGPGMADAGSALYGDPARMQQVISDDELNSIDWDNMGGDDLPF